MALRGTAERYEACRQASESPVICGLHPQEGQDSTAPTGFLAPIPHTARGHRPTRSPAHAVTTRTIHSPDSIHIRQCLVRPTHSTESDPKPNALDPGGVVPVEAATDEMYSLQRCGHTSIYLAWRGGKVGRQPSRCTRQSVQPGPQQIPYATS